MKTITLTDDEASDVATIIRAYAEEVRRDAQELPTGPRFDMFRAAMRDAAESRETLAKKFEED